VWLSPTNLTDLIWILSQTERPPIFRVRKLRWDLEYLLPPLTPLCRPTPTRRLSTSLPGLWVPPTELRTQESEQLFEYTPSELQELWSEITATLLVSPKRK